MYLTKLYHYSHSLSTDSGRATPQCQSEISSLSLLSAAVRSVIYHMVETYITGQRRRAGLGHQAGFIKDKCSAYIIDHYERQERPHIVILENKMTPTPDTYII